MPRLNPTFLPLARPRFSRPRGAGLAAAVAASAAAAVVCAVLALGLSGTAQAQSLQALYDAARGYDAAYQSARSQADSVVFRAEQSRALRRPSVSGTATWAENRSETPYSSTTVTRTSQQSVGVSAQQSLFNRGNDKTIAQADKAVEVARSQLAAVEQDLIVRLAQAYFDVLAASDALATVQTSKKAIAEQLASAKRNFEVGTATITDTREAQARFDLATARELVADNDLRTKRTVLDQLVGRAAVEPKGLALPVVLLQVTPASPDEWVSAADDRHPSIRKARLAQDLARLETDKARAGHLPTVNLVANLQNSNSRGTAVTDVLARPGNTATTSVGVQFNLPLFAGFAVQNRVKETLVLEDKARNDFEGARRGVALGTRSAFLGVQSLQAQVKALEAAEASTKLALEATQLGYKVGVRVNLDVLNAQSQLFDTQRDLAKARYDVIVTGLKLRQASGQLRPVDVQAIDAQLR